MSHIFSCGEGQGNPGIDKAGRSTGSLKALIGFVTAAAWRTALVCHRCLYRLNWGGYRRLGKAPGRPVAKLRSRLQGLMVGLEITLWWRR